MPATASANCHMISGRSGLPKFRQLVAPIGSAPAHATFRAASATASFAPSRAADRPPVNRRCISERRIRPLGDDGPVTLDPHQAVGRHLANPYGVQIPFLENALGLGFAAALDDQRHALL